MAVTALAATDAAIASTTDVCLPFLEAAFDEAAADETVDTTTDTTADSTTDTTADTTADTTTDTTAATPLTAAEKLAAAKLALADCQSAITAVLAGQTATNEAQASVLTFVDDLNQSVSALQNAVAGTAKSGSTGSAAATVPRTSASAGSSAASATSAAATSAAEVPSTTAGGAAAATVASAETIVADQAEIDAAVAELAIAERNLTLATLTSPIAGTVAAVDLAVGDTVTASSSSAGITIIGEDGFVVSTTVSLPDIAGVVVGQSAAVDVASVDDELSGRVSAIGILNVSSSSTPSYTVQIALESTDPALLNGGSAAVAVAVASLDEVFTVPTSAVHLADAIYTVDLLENGVSMSTEVTVGAVGSELTEIRSGIDIGDTVILADLNAAIASSETETASGLAGLGGDTSTELRTPPAGMVGPPAG
ncbi:HlyD family efflux transporter periplasmic adaptor subunit [Cryobacterium sp. TMS1-20-1]|nr:HlyD family efflux transporter periplasmic adaptor subunit [Cryobacterium sp. TMS1-20-1]